MFLYSRVTLSQNPLQLVIGILFTIFLYEYFQSSIVQFVRISVLGCLVLFVSLSYVTYFPSLHPTLSSCVCTSYCGIFNLFFNLSNVLNTDVDYFHGFIIALFLR